jgi:hypothetical protein
VVGARRAGVRGVEAGAGVGDLGANGARTDDNPQRNGVRVCVPDAVGNQLGHEQAERLEQRGIEVGAQPGDGPARASRGLRAARDVHGQPVLHCDLPWWHAVSGPGMTLN